MSAKQCQGKTLEGKRCKNRVSDGKFCSRHSEPDSSGSGKLLQVASLTVGALSAIGNADKIIHNMSVVAQYVAAHWDVVSRFWHFTGGGIAGGKGWDPELDPAFEPRRLTLDARCSVLLDKETVSERE
jgi:hypothetical protein